MAVIIDEFEVVSEPVADNANITSEVDEPVAISLSTSDLEEIICYLSERLARVQAT